jgi:hypothetical protein
LKSLYLELLPLDNIDVKDRWASGARPAQLSSIPGLRQVQLGLSSKRIYCVIPDNRAGVNSQCGWLVVK